jgi:hypothetical protein
MGAPDVGPDPGPAAELGMIRGATAGTGLEGVLDAGPLVTVVAAGGTCGEVLARERGSPAIGHVEKAKTMKKIQLRTMLISSKCQKMLTLPMPWKPKAWLKKISWMSFQNTM